jgi:NADP-dependent 3-hydroxy acid dehydrogenase YdfG
MSGIEGKVVAVTGASSGIGEATALLLAERGAKVVLGARGLERLKALADRIVKAGGEVAYARTDARRREDLSNLAMPVFGRQGSGHFVNTASTAGHTTVPNQSVYSGTKFAVRAISEGLRQEAGGKLRMTIISPGFVRTEFVEAVANPELRARLADSRDRFAMPPDAIARAIAFAIEQAANVDVNEIAIRPTAQA